MKRGRRYGTPLALRMAREVSPRLLWRFVVGAGVGNMRAIHRFRREQRRGAPIFPPFVFVSVTQRCNLSCTGCWAVGGDNPVDMERGLLEQIVADSGKRGCRFFGILGGEPLLVPWLCDFFSKHRDNYFQLFTNGHFLDDAYAAELRRCGNVTPLISIEGVGESYVARRGSTGGESAALAALESCRRHGLVSGVATSVSGSNFNDVVCQEFIESMERAGAHYLWFYIYRPSGSEPGMGEALSDEQVIALRRFLLEQRRLCRSMVLIDAYWDDEGHPMCPAAAGISHHIGARGDVEPCPPIQCADVRVAAGADRDIGSEIEGSEFLRRFRCEVPGVSSGCILMDHPHELGELARSCGAWDSSGRGSFFEELEGRQVLGCHNHSGEPLREPSWVYRLAKRQLFFGFGSYG